MVLIHGEAQNDREIVTGYRVVLVEHDVGHFRFAAGGGLLSKSQSMGGPIRDEASGGIGNNALKASSFAQHVCCFCYTSFVC